MLFNFFLYDANWWVFCLLIFLVLMLISRFSFWAGKKHAHKIFPGQASQLTTSAQVMLALSSFLLVICYNIAENRFDQRKSLVLNEANALSTLYLRTDFLPDKQKEEAQALIREYLRSRINLKSLKQIQKAMAKSREIHQALWKNALKAGQSGQRPVLNSLYFQTLNQVIDIHSERYNRVLIYRTPASMIYALFFSTTLSLCLLAFSFGLSGGQSMSAIVGPIVLFSIILILIIDLDNTRQRFFKISQGPLTDVLQSIEKK